MTIEKLTSVFEFYRKWIEAEWRVVPSRSDEYGEHLGHLAWMCQECVTVLIPSGDIEKAMRWLGFVQGVLCARQFFTVNQLRDHNRTEVQP